MLRLEPGQEGGYRRAMVYTDKQLDAIRVQVQALRQSSRESHRAFEAMLQSHGLDASSAMAAFDQAPSSLRQQLDAHLRDAMAAAHGAADRVWPSFLPQPGVLPAPSPPAAPPASSVAASRLIGGHLKSRI